MSTSTPDTLRRQWAMLRLIPRMPRKVSARELQKQLAVQGFATSSRTIERDLQHLSGFFGLVVDESGRPFGWSWARDANFEFTPRLSVSQGVALLLSRAHLRNFLPQAVLKELAPLFEQAEREVASTGWKDWHRRTALVPTSFPLLAPRVSAEVLEDVHLALAQKHCLTGRYRAKGSPAGKDMTIHPLGLLVRGSAQYLVCTLRDYKDIRHLALHRLSHTAVLEAPCVPPEGFDFGRYVATQATKYQARGTIRLVARFTAEAAKHLLDTPVSKDQAIVELDGGTWVELSATVDDDQTLLWWLLGFGENVEVREPRALRDEIGRQLRAATGRYVGS